MQYRTLHAVTECADRPTEPLKRTNPFSNSWERARTSSGADCQLDHAHLSVSECPDTAQVHSCQEVYACCLARWQEHSCLHSPGTSLQEVCYLQTSEDQRAPATCQAAVGPKITWALLDFLFKQNAHTESYPATLTWVLCRKWLYQTCFRNKVLL